jgi:hypothetical protein
MANIELEVQSVEHMLMQEEGCQIELSCSSGDTLKLTISTKHLMPLVEYLLLASYSISDSTGEIAAMEIVDIRTHLLMEGMIGVEPRSAQTMLPHGSHFISLPRRSSIPNLASELSK